MAVAASKPAAPARTVRRDLSLAASYPVAGPSDDRLPASPGRRLAYRQAGCAPPEAGGVGLLASGEALGAATRPSAIVRGPRILRPGAEKPSVPWIGSLAEPADAGPYAVDVRRAGWLLGLGRRPAGLHPSSSDSQSRRAAREARLVSIGPIGPARASRDGPSTPSSEPPGAFRSPHGSCTPDKATPWVAAGAHARVLHWPWRVTRWLGFSSLPLCSSRCRQAPPSWSNSESTGSAAVSDAESESALRLGGFGRERSPRRRSARA